MSLNEEATQATWNAWMWARIRDLEKELARFEQVAVSTATTPHTLKAHRADGAVDWVDNGTTMWIKNEADQ